MQLLLLFVITTIVVVELGLVGGQRVGRLAHNMALVAGHARAREVARLDVPLDRGVVAGLVAALETLVHPIHVFHDVFFDQF